MGLLRPAETGWAYTCNHLEMLSHSIAKLSLGLSLGILLPYLVPLLQPSGNLSTHRGCFFFGEVSGRFREGFGEVLFCIRIPIRIPIRPVISQTLTFSGSVVVVVVVVIVVVVADPKTVWLRIQYSGFCGFFLQGALVK